MLFWGDKKVSLWKVEKMLNLQYFFRSSISMQLRGSKSHLVLAADTVLSISLLEKQIAYRGL